jgi:HAD superfamily hydrolase (TIGR01509 family)
MTIDEIVSHIKNTNKKIIIFDFDDTICHLNIDWEEWDKEVGLLLQKYDPHVSLKGGYMHDNLMNTFLETYGDEFRKEWKTLSNQFEKDFAKGCEPLNQIVMLIKQLEDLELWIWSSNSEEVIRRYLRELGIENKFSTFITRDNVDYIKPSADGFQKFKRFDLSEKDYLMIGNSKNDTLAAEKAGIEYVDVREIEG